MIHVGKDIRLTDELERQLMMQAIEDQYRFKPMLALKNLFSRLFAVADAVKSPSQGAVESAR